MSTEMMPNEAPAWEYDTQIFDGSWHSVVTREHPDILGNTYRNLQPLFTDRANRPAKPTAPVAEAGDGEVSRYIAKCREMSKGENEHTYTWWSRLADLLSTLEAERARADAAEQRAADALVRAENAADWQPIEAAPKGRVPFLALNYDGEVHVAAYDEHGRLMRRSHSAYRPQSFSIENGRKILISETEEWRNDWSLWTRLYEFKPTHWRPLPFLPRAAREAQPATDGGDNG